MGGIGTVGDDTMVVKCSETFFATVLRAIVWGCSDCGSIVSTCNGRCGGHIMSGGVRSPGGTKSFGVDQPRDLAVTMR